MNTLNTHAEVSQAQVNAFDTEALALTRIVCGDADAQFHMGRDYLFGCGVPVNFDTALHWFRLAAAQGHTLAQHRIGLMYWFGQGVAKDPVMAQMWFIVAASHAGDLDFLRVDSRSFATLLSHSELTKARQLACERLADACPSV
ncbi:MAG: tetratricopeptide repeat protein [Rhodoferax sp.]